MCVPDTYYCSSSRAVTWKLSSAVKSNSGSSSNSAMKTGFVSSGTEPVFVKFPVGAVVEDSSIIEVLEMGSGIDV